MNKMRLDQAIGQRKMIGSRSQAESFIRLGKVTVNGQVITKTGHQVMEYDDVKLNAAEQYVSRAGLKLASVVKTLKLNFKDKIVLDVGSSTGGFTDYALQHGARKVIAVEVGSNQLHPKLHGHPKIELHEQTDIRNVRISNKEGGVNQEKSPFTLIHSVPDIVVIDVSFVSLREILPSVHALSGSGTVVAAMVKPQFEAGNSNLKHKGVIKNERMRRDILKDFEQWARELFVVLDKADSEIAGEKGNRERFYLLRPL